MSSEFVRDIEPIVMFELMGGEGGAFSGAADFRAPANYRLPFRSE